MAVRKVLISLGHPAHFHLFKNIIPRLKELGIKPLVIIREKDILEELLKNAGIPYYNILPKDRKESLSGIILSLIKRDIRLLWFSIKERPALMIGSTVEITHVGKLLNIPALSVGEDDLGVVPMFEKFAAPFSDCIIVPRVCQLNKFEKKGIKYPGYQELAYLHPNNFTPDISVVQKYFDPQEPYFIIRFSKLAAHHDQKMNGINTEIAERVISILEPNGKILITSERKLEPEFEKYRMAITPADIHHVMAFAQLFIGDSQTMAAEAGVLGVPFVRFNDFTGRISYLNELENDYKLGFGIKSNDPDNLYHVIEELVHMANKKQVYGERRNKMLSDKIDTEKFLTWFISNYPTSKKQVNERDFSFENFK